MKQETNKKLKDNWLYRQFELARKETHNWSNSVRRANGLEPLDGDAIRIPSELLSTVTKMVEDYHKQKDSTKN